MNYRKTGNKVFLYLIKIPSLHLINSKFWVHDVFKKIEAKEEYFFSLAQSIFQIMSK